MSSVASKPAWRRFELEGIPGSFFEVAADGANVRLRLGPRDRQGREQVRAQPSEAAALAEVERLIAAHLAKGYVDVASIVPKAAPEPPRPPTAEELAAIAAREQAKRAELALKQQLRALGRPAQISQQPELEAQCRASREDPAPYAVYADWLIEHGDPRGEIAARWLRGDAAGATKLLDLFYEKLCGTGDRHFTLEFRHGFAVGATVHSRVGKTETTAALDVLTRTLLDAPIATFLESLRFGLAGFASDNNWRPTLEVVTGSQLASRLRVLRFDGYDYDDCMMNWVTVGDLSGQLTKLPVLEALHVRGGKPTLGELAFPTLRTFVRESNTLDDGELAAIGAAHWPALEHLEIWFGSRSYGARVTAEAVEPILRGAGLPRVGHLGLVNCDLAQQLIPRLAESRLLPQLYSLDLSMGTMARNATAELVRHAAAFRHLASIDLTQNTLRPREQDQICAVLDNVVIGNQRLSDEEEDDAYDDADDGDDDGRNRYVAEYE
jgi:uncharacterized protein (TIGR02996 family)